MSRRCQRVRERIACFIHGHRDLTLAVAYGEVLTGAADRELDDSGACGNPVRISISPDRHQRQRWSAAGLAGV